MTVPAPDRRLRSRCILAFAPSCSACSRSGNVVRMHVLGAAGIVAVFAPWLVPHDPMAQSLALRTARQ